MSALEGKADMPRLQLLAEANIGNANKAKHLRGLSKKLICSYYPTDIALKFAGLRRTARREFFAVSLPPPPSRCERLSVRFCY
jgi:hypothetical protein